MRNVKSGFTLVEVLVSVLIAAFLAMVVAGVSVFSLKNERQVRTLSQIDLFRGVLVSTIQGGRSWDKTTALNAPTAKFDCLTSTTLYCTDNGAASGAVLGETPFAIYDAAGTLVYDSTNPANGITTDGTLCSKYDDAPGAGNDDCPLRFEVTWKPVCATGAQCKTPPIKVAARLKYNGKSGGSPLVTNPQAYSIAGFYRNPTSSGAGPAGPVTPGNADLAGAVGGCTPFTIPNYNTLTVELWGAGGGGLGAMIGGASAVSPPLDGGNTTFGQILFAQGGGGGSFGGFNAPDSFAGRGGIGIGGDVNQTGGNSALTTNANSAGGNGANGGPGGAGGVTNPWWAGNPGGYPGGGGSGAPTNTHSYRTLGGGGGGYVKKTFQPGQLEPGSQVGVCVGQGGSQTFGTYGASGGRGADGKAFVSWQ